MMKMWQKLILHREIERENKAALEAWKEEEKEERKEEEEAGA